jgi:hypothetical protein
VLESTVEFKHWLLAYTSLLVESVRGGEPGTGSAWGELGGGRESGREGGRERERERDREREAGHGRREGENMALVVQGERQGERVAEDEGTHWSVGGR